MVKVSFNSALGRKEMQKDAEILLPEEQSGAEVAVPTGSPSRAWCWCMCLGLALMLSGVVIGGVYLYHYYFTEEEQVFFCGMRYHEEDFMVNDEVDELSHQQLLQLQERIQILEKEQVELVNIPVPGFGDGDPAKIVHDFQRSLTAYYDQSLDKCYVIPLNTSIVMPPRDLLELLVNIKAGTYLPRSYLVHEEMVVTERLQRVDQLGSYIYSLCRGKDTFKLQRRDHILGMQKRDVHNCRRIRHFESHVVVETQICEL
ncbi:integral membrane protein 2B [Takifugu rubripes]|uniref:Integral membrane protein 2 n=1 Tax=Takifugu rubripes TaxID=31033 RepID=H2UFI1_TAKRU|nr:integral membrane protein 2B [Takifugu rubripes]|eukprot:XP_003976733.1 PREDICTED: integral membrane protein 2B [Takifugu rubripes]